jgi:preprotein translocase subunit YajC
MGNTILAAASKSSSGGSYFFLLIIVAVLALMYFVTIRPQRNRQRQVQQTQRDVVPGQRVRTTAGMYATVVEMDGNDVVLEAAPGVEMRFLRRSIMEVLPDEDEDGGTGEYGSDEEAGADDETAHDADGETADEAGDSQTAPVADTASEDETTQEAPAAPNANGKSPSDEGRPAGR